MLSSHRKDSLIAWMKEMLHHSFALNEKESYFDTFKYFEELVEEERDFVARGVKRKSRLRQQVPTIGTFFTSLPMERAFRFYDNKYAVTRRRHSAPSFNEIRHTLNLAQIQGSGDSLRFISFDGDQTLYEDGGNFAHDSELSVAIRSLLTHGVYVALITAAGYGYEGPKYEQRLRGLLDGFASSKLDAESVGRFFVVGGECNYYLRCKKTDSVVNLVRVSDEMWAQSAPGPSPQEWPEEDCQRILDLAENSMKNSMEELRLRARIIRKKRGLGIISGGPDSVARVPNGHGSIKLKREALDEIALRCHEVLSNAEPEVTLPWCCFNGGRDVWCDVGNKKVGVEVMQKLLGIKVEQCIHVGDQFLYSGNDYAAREVCPCIWITSPAETQKILAHILRALGLHAPEPPSYSDSMEPPAQKPRTEGGYIQK